MNRFMLGVGMASFLLTQSTAAAALQLDIGPKHGAVATSANIDAFPLPGQQALDLIFTETAPTENEGLFAYDVLVSVPVAARNLITLAGAEKPADNFVLDVPSGATFSVAESDANHVLINVSSNNELADITTGKKAARILYTLTPAALAQGWTFSGPVLVFDTGSTVFGSGDPNRDVNIVVDLTDAGILLLPEPTDLTLLGMAGVLCLRRRAGACPVNTGAQ